MEAGAGDPWIPTDWTNVSLDAGDTEAEAGTVHSGSGSMEWNTGASNEPIKYNSADFTAGKYYAIGGWFYGDGSVGFQFGALSDTKGLLQSSSSANSTASNVTAGWVHNAGVWRALVVDFEPWFRANSGAAGDRFLDDLYMVELDDVSLTAAAASEANSAEDSGLRADGLDTMTQTIAEGELGAKAGKIRCKWTPRHSAGIMKDDFGVSQPYIFRALKDGSNEIFVYWTADTTIRATFEVGGVTTSDDWAGIGAGDIAAGTEYLMEVEYNASRFTLKVDGSVKATGIPGAGIDFGANIPDTIYWGTDATGINQSDAVFTNP